MWNLKPGTTLDYEREEAFSDLGLSEIFTKEVSKETTEEKDERWVTTESLRIYTGENGKLYLFLDTEEDLFTPEYFGESCAISEVLQIATPFGKEAR